VTGYNLSTFWRLEELMAARKKPATSNASAAKQQPSAQARPTRTQLAAQRRGVELLKLCVPKEEPRKKVVFDLLWAGADLSVTDDKGWTALHHATTNLHAEAVQLLLTRARTKAPVNQLADGKTALHMAAEIAAKTRVEHWFSEGEINGVPASYTIEKGVLTYRKHGKPTPIKYSDEVVIASRWCEPHHRWLMALQMIEFLVTNTKIDPGLKKQLLALGNAKLTKRLSKK
jgi:hypothetical protein